MTDTAWHAPRDVLTAFARAPRALDSTTAASLETHLAVCEQCRATVADAADASLSVLSWDAVAERIDRPRRSWAERVLGAILPPHTARLLAATPMLQAVWIAAVVVLSAAAVAATRNLQSDGVFLALAPLVPVAGVAIAFAPATDPAGETALATPAYGAGLVIARTLAVVATTLPILLIGSAFLPIVDAHAIAWLLPALALTAVVTALSTWLIPQTAGAVVATAWALAAFTVPRIDGASTPMARSELFGPAAQVAFAALLLAALVIGTSRREHFTTLETR